MKARNISRKDAKAAKESILSFRPKGEIFLRSLAFARDDGPGPSLGVLGVLARVTPIPGELHQRATSFSCAASCQRTSLGIVTSAARRVR
jgi:hypothetical protein